MKRVAIFAHYDKSNSVNEYVVKYLEFLKSKIEKIIFISDCNLSQKEISKIEHLSYATLCERHGESNDFGSYKRGMKFLLEKCGNLISQIDELVFVNDSCYCLGSLDNIFDTMSKRKDIDAWTINDHFIKEYTVLQTNFFVFRGRLITERYIHDFFLNIKKCENKNDIVVNYEIGLSLLLLKNNNKLDVVFGYKKIEQFIESKSDEFELDINQKVISKYDVEIEHILYRIFNCSVGYDYVYSDHFYSLIKIGCPLVKCLALVPNNDIGSRNYLSDFWQEIISDNFGDSYKNMILDHIMSIGKTPKNPLSPALVSCEKSKNRIVLFAHYDKENKIDDYVIDYLKKLSKISKKIIFSSDSILSSSQKNKIKHIVSDIIFEVHREYDFGSHKRSFKLLKDKYSNELKECYEIVLANDSCYCVNSFVKIFNDMESINCDAWSLGDDYENYETKFYYLQSYFLVLRKSVFLEKFFDDFLMGIIALKDKNDIIREYEMGFTKLLNKNNKLIFSYFSSEKVINYLVEDRFNIRSEICDILKDRSDLVKKECISNLFDISSLNHIHSSKFYILLKLKFPLIKRAIIDSSIHTFDNEKLTFFWYEILHKVTYFDNRIILNHTNRISIACKKPISNIHPIINIKSTFSKKVKVKTFKKKFLFYNKITKSGKRIIKIFGIPIIHIKVRQVRN